MRICHICPMHDPLNMVRIFNQNKKLSLGLGLMQVLFLWEIMLCNPDTMGIYYKDNTVVLKIFPLLRHLVKKQNEVWTVEVLLGFDLKQPGTLQIQL